MEYLKTEFSKENINCCEPHYLTQLRAGPRLIEEEAGGF